VATNSNGSEIGYQTVVSLTTGIVVVTDRETGNVSTLKTGGASKTTGNVEPHSHYHTHGNGERHMHDHPSQNQAHHGKAQSGTDDDGSSADPGDITICHNPLTTKKTIVINPSSLSGHLGHGDSVGACP
jgi:hypothetical protein